jgi:hypothetical protein
MSSSPMSVAPPVTDVLDPQPVESGSCIVCPHAPADHDRISLRFCQATQAAAMSRGCVCPS